MVGDCFSSHHPRLLTEQQCHVTDINTVDRPNDRTIQRSEGGACVLPEGTCPWAGQLSHLSDFIRYTNYSIAGNNEHSHWAGRPRLPDEA